MSNIKCNHAYGNESNLPAEVSDGKLYITTDTNRLYADLNSKRFQVTDIVFIEKEANLPILGLTDKIYVARAEGSMWLYNGGWVQLSLPTALLTPYTGNVTLSSNTWQGTTAPYSIAINVNGLIAAYRATHELVLSEAYATNKIERTEASKVYQGIATDGTYTFYADEIPSCDLTYKLTVYRY